MIASRRHMLLAISAAAAMLGLAALVLTPAGTDSGQQCRASKAVAERLRPLATGELAAFQVASSPSPLPALIFNGPDGQKTGLEAFRGKVALVNLWATWCIPCRKEMPGLDALQADMGGKDFSVVAINIDTRNLDKPRQWLAEAGVTRLTYYADPEAKVFQELRARGKAVGMPTTLLVDAEGCELGLIHGAAEWASPDARRMIKAALGS